MTQSRDKRKQPIDDGVIRFGKRKKAFKRFQVMLITTPNPEEVDSRHWYTPLFRSESGAYAKLNDALLGYERMKRGHTMQFAKPRGREACFKLYDLSTNTDITYLLDGSAR